MYFENRKFGDNQFTIKLLPPPPRIEVAQAALEVLETSAVYSKAA